MAKIILTSWNPGLQKVQLSRLLRGQGGLRLKDAKGCVDDLLEGKQVCIEMKALEEAQALAKEITLLGANCEVIE